MCSCVKPQTSANYKESTVCNKQRSFYAPAALSGSECMLLTVRAAPKALVMFEPAR